LDCSDNNLDTLDVSGAFALENLDCSDNQLKSLDLRNNNNSNFTYFTSIDNLYLTCISVDDITWSTNNWTNIDSQTDFSFSCGPCGPLTGVNLTDIIDDRATFNWSNMNQGNCSVDQIVIRYRELGTIDWDQKYLGSPTLSTIHYGMSKRILGLSASTTYEYQFKIWYMGASGPINWSENPSGAFTTLGSCPNVGNFTVVTPFANRATFTWDDSNGAYSFVRIKMRVDSISIPVASDWFTAGGFGVNYPTFIKSKNGLIPGETYRAQARTWCDPTGGPYKSDGWTSLVSWNQPTAIRLGSGSAIANLDIYPNPSRDIFNVSFTSETIQDFKVRILNVVGEELVNEDLQQFIGEYTKKINLSNNAKGIYLLEIETNDGLINKKLILQ